MRYSAVWHGSLTEMKTFHAFTHHPRATICAVFQAIESAAQKETRSLIFIQEAGYKRSHTAQLNPGETSHLKFGEQLREEIIQRLDILGFLLLHKTKTF